MPIQQQLSVPHFVGIGPPRSGTTWVFKMLRLHPRIWMPWKEVHYFDSVDPEQRTRYRIQSRIFRLKHGWPYLVRRLAARAIPGSTAISHRYFPLKAVQPIGLRWTVHYLTGRSSLDWYAGLFRAGERKGLRCGEITPAYSTLSVAAIRDFTDVLPDVRTFMILRNPVDLAWSAVCRKARGAGLNPADLSDGELMALSPVPGRESRGDVGANIARWLDNFPRERMYIGNYEDIQRNPVAFLDSLSVFIGAGPFPRRWHNLVRHNVNSSARGVQPPPAVRAFIARQFLDEIRTLAARTGNVAEQWLAEAEEIAGQRRG